MSAITTTKTKLALKSVFGDVGSIVYSPSDLKIAKADSGATTITLPADGIELPCATDTLTMSQSAPTINHYKVVGLTSDWFSTSEPGDLEFSLEVPTKHTDILEAFFGEDNVYEAKVGTDWDGSALILNDKTVTGTLLLVNKTEDQIMILNNVKFWATPSYENSSTEPFKFTLTGTVEAGDSNDDANIIWLKKGTSRD